MPRGSPFTTLCRHVAALARPLAADLHAHTTASDGDYTPSQVVALARQARLAAVAVTDHDTVAGVGAAVESANRLGPGGPEVIPGAELTAEYGGREYHVLGLFLRADDEQLTKTLADVCARRRERFHQFVAVLEQSGLRFADGLAAVTASRAASLGRRHVATMLVTAGFARSNYDAFQRVLIPASRDVPPRHQTPMAAVIRTVRDAGGVPVLAHPRPDVEDHTVAELAHLGLLGIEVAFPAASVSHTQRLRELAIRSGLAVSGGSDCHGPGLASRAIGGRGVSREELHALRELSGSPG